MKNFKLGISHTHMLAGDIYADSDSDLENAIKMYTKAAEAYQSIQG